MTIPWIRRWTRLAAGAAGISLALTAAALLSACSVGPFRADALTAPFPDGPFDGIGAGDRAHAGGDGGPAGLQCDLVTQNCPDPKQSCYPADGEPGVTICNLPGSGPPSTACVSNYECDVREACVFVSESLLFMCVTICNPLASITGCLPKAPCTLIPGYTAGYCVP